MDLGKTPLARAAVAIGSSCSVVPDEERSEMNFAHKTLYPPLYNFESSKRQYANEANAKAPMPWPDSKILMKSTKMSANIVPCSKRPKLEQGPASTENDNADLVNHFQKIGSALAHSTDKSRLGKQKRCHDVKRSEKRNIRAGPRSKYDCYTSTTLVSHNFPDYSDVTKHMEEVPLSELLSGSYKYSNVCRDKGKKSPHPKDDLLASFKKVCSILLSTGDGNITSRATRDHDSSSLITLGSTWCNAPLYQPKDVLDRLALPSCRDPGPVFSAPLTQPDSPTIRGINLLPSPWSYPQIGSHRCSNDYGKYTSAKTSSQGQWLRLRSYCGHEGGSRPCFSELEIENLVKPEDLCAENPHGEKLNGPKSNSFRAHLPQCSNGAYLPAVTQLRPQEYTVLPRKFDEGDLCDHSTSAFVANSRHVEVAERAQCVGTNCGASGSFCCTSCESAAQECCEVSGSFGMNDPPDPDCSPRSLSAAEILCEMANFSKTLTLQGYSNGMTKWPKSPLQKLVKARKLSSSPSGRLPAPPSSLKHPDASFRSSLGQSAKDWTLEKSELPHPNSSSGKSPIRWPKLEAGTPPLYARQSHPDRTKQGSLLSPRARIEKDYDNQQRLRKATLAASLGYPASDSNKATRNKRL